MASLYPKKVGGRTYWYLREMARVDGRPKMVSERYLGTAAEIGALLDAREAAILPERTRHLAFGDVAAAWGMLQDLSVVSMIDAVAGPRPAGQPLSTGTYLALAALNRLVAPCSKAGFADWWKTTAADRFTKIPASALDHRRFWDAMHAVTPAQLEQASEAIAAAIVRAGQVDVSSVALDMTNFATFIASGNGRAPIAQRGKAKQKRTDLRIVGLGLVVTRDGGIPLTWHAYPGDRPDVTQFPFMISQLEARYEAVCAAAGLTLEAPDMTVVFDAGQNSEANLAHFAATGLHFIGSVPASDCPDLTSLPASERAVVDRDRFGGLTAFDTRRTVYGAERRAILTHSPELHEAQAAGFAGTTLAKAGKKIDELASTLSRGKTRRPRDKVEAEIASITAKPWVRRVVRWELSGDQPKDLRLSWHVDEQARAALEEEIFGKHVLVTSHDDWPVPEVVAGYRSQSEAEFSFRQMKDPRVVSFSPMRHWTEHNIRVHVFTCVLALQIAHLMRHRARLAGLSMSVRELLGQLAAIGETVLIYPSAGGRPKARRMTTELTADQPELHRIFGLQRWAPTSLGHTPKQPLAIHSPAETLTEDHNHRKLRLRVGIACDISGSMGAFTGPVASAAWILARAAGHLPSAVTASVLFGKGVYALTRPGEKPAKVTDFKATASSESACRAIDALDGALDLASPGTARLLVIVSDTWFVAPGEPAGAQQRITRLHRAGCGVIILTPKGWAGLCKYTDCQVIEAGDPADAIDAIARAATRALTA